jgi:hypothetical protein
MSYINTYTRVTSYLFIYSVQTRSSDIQNIRTLITTEDTDSVAAAVISSRLDYCNRCFSVRLMRTIGIISVFRTDLLEASLLVLLTFVHITDPRLPSLAAGSSTNPLQTVESTDDGSFSKLA